MKDVVITLPVFDNDAVKKLSVVPGHEKKGIKSFVVTVNAMAFINQADKLDAFRAINPREPRRSSLAWKAMRETLDDSPDQFFYRNKGLLMLADDFVFDNKNQSITITLNNRSFHGIADGGHTYDVLKDYFSDSTDELAKDEVYLKIEFLVGFNTRESVTDIVESRNTALQVRKETLYNMMNVFDDIKVAVDGKPYQNQISYSEYETDDDGRVKKIKVADLVGYLVAYNIDKYPIEGENVPIEAYSSKKKVLETFEKMFDEKNVAKYTRLLPDIVELWDNINLNMPKILGDDFRTIEKRSGDLVVKQRRVLLPYIDDEVDYAIPAGWIYPLFASFRNLLVEDNGILKFSKNPSEFLEENLQDIALPYKKALKEVGYEPQTFAKSRLVWTTLDLKMDQLVRNKR